ncbi:hypothetical protein SNEBB_004712 [Seison nebaliae]|nr:hypothetical protein SNEBB_004712 [Seison nebaliae]
MSAKSDGKAKDCSKHVRIVLSLDSKRILFKLMRFMETKRGANNTIMIPNIMKFLSEATGLSRSTLQTVKKLGTMYGMQMGEMKDPKLFTSIIDRALNDYAEEGKNFCLEHLYNRLIQTGDLPEMSKRIFAKTLLRLGYRATKKEGKLFIRKMSPKVKSTHNNSNTKTCTNKNSSVKPSATIDNPTKRAKTDKSLGTNPNEIGTNINVTDTSKMNVELDNCLNQATIDGELAFQLEQINESCISNIPQIPSENHNNNMNNETIPNNNLLINNYCTDYNNKQENQFIPNDTYTFQQQSIPYDLQFYQNFYSNQQEEIEMQKLFSSTVFSENNKSNNLNGNYVNDELDIIYNNGEFRRMENEKTQMPSDEWYSTYSVGMEYENLFDSQMFNSDNLVTSNNLNPNSLTPFSVDQNPIDLNNRTNLNYSNHL